VRKFARELGADLGQVKGTGPKGRITHEDVKAYVKKLLSAPPAAAGGLPKVPEVDFAQFGAVESEPLSRIQLISGARLQASWINLPHVTQHEDADITDLDIARVALKPKAKQEGVPLTPLAFIIRACVVALKKFPRFNASLDASGKNLVLKKYFHIGFAADTPNGLLVPVIRDADRLNLFDLARALATLAEKARAGKLSAAEMQGGSFTVSSLGGIGGTAFTPIINAPEVAILGVSRSVHKPVFEKGTFVPRLMLPLSLSYDHRVIDGAQAARFVVFLRSDAWRREGVAMSEVEVRVPDLGDTKAATVVEVLISVGAQIAVDDPLITLESEKASMDIPSTAAGTVASIAVKKGQEVSSGTVIAVVTSAKSEAAPDEKAARVADEKACPRRQAGD
jgi:pyruvate dehydrogenase E2 component (dihydrolipoamide acetyltransferase)